MARSPTISSMDWPVSCEYTVVNGKSPGTGDPGGPTLRMIKMESGKDTFSVKHVRISSPIVVTTGPSTTARLVANS